MKNINTSVNELIQKEKDAFSVQIQVLKKDQIRLIQEFKEKVSQKELEHLRNTLT